MGIRTLPSPAWDRLRAPEIESDLWLTHLWLKENLGTFQPTGVYLGWSGLHFEIGLTQTADPQKLSMDWAYRLEQYGDEHAIDGSRNALKSLRKSGLAGDGLLHLAQHMFMFGYGGLVLASAIERLAIDWDCLFIWGPHDGGLGYLLRTSKTGVTRIARLKNS